MSFSAWFHSARRVAMLGAAVVLLAGSAFAQDSPNSQVISSDEFSSSSAGIPAAELVSAPSPAAGQYDNRSRGTDHGWRDKAAFEFGGGFNMPTNESSPYINTGYQFTVGGGLHLNQMLALMIDYQFINDGLPSKVVNEAGASGGNVHLWSLTLNPEINLMPKKANSIYVAGGGGFYRKVTSFTDPQQVQYCTYYYCGIYTQNQVVGHFSSNQGGWNVGAGYAHRFGGMYNDGKMQFFAEARYLDVLSPAVVGQSANGLNPATIGAGTKLIPISFGLRF